MGLALPALLLQIPLSVKTHKNTNKKCFEITETEDFSLRVYVPLSADVQKMKTMISRRDEKNVCFKQILSGNMSLMSFALK